MVLPPTVLNPQSLVTLDFVELLLVLILPKYQALALQVLEVVVKDLAIVEVPRDQRR